MVSTLRDQHLLVGGGDAASANFCVDISGFYFSFRSVTCALTMHATGWLGGRARRGTRAAPGPVVRSDSASAASFRDQGRGGRGGGGTGGGALGPRVLGYYDTWKLVPRKLGY